MDTLSFLHKMKELKGQDRNDYLLKNAPLIFAHYRENNQFNKYYRQYLSCPFNSFIFRLCKKESVSIVYFIFYSF